MPCIQQITRVWVTAKSTGNRFVLTQQTTPHPTKQYPIQDSPVSHGLKQVNNFLVGLHLLKEPSSSSQMPTSCMYVDHKKSLFFQDVVANVSLFVSSTQDIQLRITCLEICLQIHGLPSLKLTKTPRRKSAILTPLKR